VSPVEPGGPENLREADTGPRKLDIRREAARAFGAVNEDFRQEFESIKAEGDASKLLRLFRRAAMARIGVNTLVVGREDSGPLSVIEEGETAAEREAIGEMNGSLRRLEETVEEVWNEYEAVRGNRDSATADDNVFPLPFLHMRRRAG
jgi:hypothetical protein